MNPATLGHHDRTSSGDQLVGGDVVPDTPHVHETLLMRDSEVLHYAAAGNTVLGKVLCVQLQPVSTQGLQTAVENSVGGELAGPPEIQSIGVDGLAWVAHAGVAVTPHP